MKRTVLQFDDYSEKPRLKELKKLLKRLRTGACIIYCNSQYHAQIIYQSVSKWYPGEVTQYTPAHGKKRPVISQLLDSRYRFLVTTASIYKGRKDANVRSIIYFSMPMSLNNYARQTEKFCRGGESVECVLMYSDTDYYDNKAALQSMRDHNDRFAYSSKFAELAATCHYLEAKV